MKKLLISLFGFLALGAFWFASVSNVALAGWVTTTPFTASQQTTTIGVVGGGDLKWSDSLIKTIQTAVNTILWFLGLIALIILLWGGFQMVTAAGDENKHKKGFTILKQAGIGLIFIGLAALFVQLIFWFITTITK